MLIITKGLRTYYQVFIEWYPHIGYDKIKSIPSPSSFFLLCLGGSYGHLVVIFKFYLLTDVRSHQFQDRACEVPAGQRLTLWSWYRKERLLGDEGNENEDGHRLWSACQILGGQNPCRKISLWHCISHCAELICVIFLPLVDCTFY